MCCAIGTDRDSGVSTNDFEIDVLKAAGGADLLPVTAGGEGGIAGNEGDFAGQGHAAGDGGERLFSDAHLNEAIWESFFEVENASRFAKVCA